MAGRKLAVRVAVKTIGLRAASCLIWSLATAPVLANSTDDAIDLYNQHNYQQARTVFEKDTPETLRSADAAYYYALTLNDVGQTDKGIEVCKQIIQRFPGTNAAKMAKSAIQTWTVKTMALSPDLGIVGFKFKINPNVHSHPEIMTVFPDTPAARCGLAIGDVILAANGSETEGLSKEQVYKLVTGKPATKLVVLVERAGQTFEKSLMRMRARDFEKVHPDIWQQYVNDR